MASKRFVELICVDIMAVLKLESKYKLKSGYQIPVLGYGVSMFSKSQDNTCTD